MAHVEYLDVDSTIDEKFMYYLSDRVFNIDAMVLDYTGPF